MKLDSRILKGKKPLDCIDAENKELIKPFLNKEGYVSNNLASYCFLNKCPKRFLSNVFKEVRNCFKTCINGGDGGDWKYFLPEEWIKEPEEKPEKKYRPFTLNEFLERYKIGDTVTFRMKKDKHIPEAECLIEYKRMITGYEILPEDKDTPGKGSILLGGCPPTGLARLFEFYELENDGEWQPFGIIDESQE